MPFIAFNNIKRAYLTVDSFKRWSLTTDIVKAYRSPGKDRLVSITKAQSKLMPADWRIDEINDAMQTPQKNEEQKETEEMKQPEEVKQKEPEIVIHNKDNPVCGVWKASEEYKAVLGAVGVLSKYATIEYANRLREQLDECNNEILDIEHYAEITPMNMPRAYKAMVRLRQIRLRRRDIQQQIALINRVQKCSSIAELTDGRFEEPSDVVTKHYVPRSAFGEKMDWGKNA